MTTITLDPSNETQVELKNKIDLLFHDIVEMSVCIHDFNSKEALTNSYDSTVKSLQSLSERNPELESIPIPLDVLQYIEDGRNPDVYTREFFESIKKANQNLNGKMLAMRQLRDCLCEKMIDELPELKGPIEDIVKRTNY